ncbi:hypothetical protein BpHYR1_012821 [Brachionus plicatilis]|uniref:Uncharacterized protein n=1 Tax=Brachionus plicatilis TaxID=10195 RepID=A0A3M7SJJ6_BRAPC|nr:hypothetical protein BpHYR1_012821 [Brachionus plicatilis]
MLRLGNGRLSCLDYLSNKVVGRLSLITEKSNSLIILSNIMPFSFSPTQPIFFVLALRSPPKIPEAHWVDYKD